MRKLCFLSTTLLFFVSSDLRAASSLDYRLPTVPDPNAPIEVFLDLTSDRTDIASVGARLTYDSASVTFASLEIGAGVPGSWSFIYQETSVAGQVDFVLTDVTAAAATITGPVAGLEVVKVTFSRVGTSCGTSNYGFNASSPDPGPPTAAFPENQYIIYISGSLITETATTTPASGPTVDDNTFIRGNINNRSAHVLDLGDVVDLVNALFGGFVLSFDCQAAEDVDNSGGSNIVDVVGLVQGVFGTSGFVIPPPNAVEPGPGIPGLVTVDGGTIPSVLGCNDGESCP